MNRPARSAAGRRRSQCTEAPRRRPATPPPRSHGWHGGHGQQWRQWACGALFACGALQPLALGAAVDPAGLRESIDAMVRDGFEHPADSLLALQLLLQASSTPPEYRRHLLRAIGVVEARSGRTADAEAIIQQLLAEGAAGAAGSGRAASAASGAPAPLPDAGARTPGQPVGASAADARKPHDGRAQPMAPAAADAAVVQAELARNAGRLEQAAALAQQALPAVEGGCGVEPALPNGAAAAAALDAAAGCDYRAAWQLRRILELWARSAGIHVNATEQAEAGLRLAERAGDSRRQLVNLSSLAELAQQRGEADLAERLLGRAQSAAARTGELTQRAGISDAVARLAAERGDFTAALAAFQDAATLASRAGAPRLAAYMLTSVGDTYERLGRHAEALQTAERALVTVRRFDDRVAEQLLVHNAGIAKLRLGRVGEARDDLERVLDFWSRSGDKGRQADALQEYGEALAAAGDAQGALTVYHRERDLSDELMRVNREAALAELRRRHDAQARQRDIDLRRQDNALMTEALASQDLLQHISWLVAAATLLGCALAALLYRRVRRVNRQLASSHAALQLQSECDPLTMLANRRRFEAAVAGRGQAGAGDFRGGLLLIDIDHFKLVNDAHGHAGGDQVLVAVAQRLNDAVRDGELVVRWGGEEFLILVPEHLARSAAQLQPLAERVLRCIGQTPIPAGGRALTVTASIGYAQFPLPPYLVKLPWQQAINLVDLALYHAKTNGRNRAVGISAAAVRHADALRAVEADFKQACANGVLTLSQTVGPVPPQGSRLAEAA